MSYRSTDSYSHGDSCLETKKAVAFVEENYGEQEVFLLKILIIYFREWGREGDRGEETLM